MKKNKYLKNKGYSLLELLLVLGIIAALVVAAFIIYPKIQASQRATNEISNISAIDAGIKSLYSSTADYSNINNTVLMNSKIFPQNMINSSNVRNSFKGNVVIKASSYSSGSYQMTYYNVPQVECSKISIAVFNKFAQVQINSKVLKNPYQTITVDSVLADITELCATNVNTLYFDSF